MTGPEFEADAIVVPVFMAALILALFWAWDKIRRKR